MQEEYQPQDRNNPNLEKPWGQALANLQSLGKVLQLSDLELEIALQQAVFNPKVALVDPKSKDIEIEKTLWRVKCLVWNGTKIELYTTNGDRANKCRDTFGWEIEPENPKEEGRYKYSKDLKDTAETRGFFEWIKVPGEVIPSDEDKKQGRKRDKGKSQGENEKPDMIAATWTSNLTDGSKESRENQKGIKLWRKHTIQRWLWINMEVRELLPEELKKAERIDTDKVLLPAEGAKRLLECVDKGKCKAMDELRDWLERSMKAGQAEGS